MKLISLFRFLILFVAFAAGFSIHAQAEVRMPNPLKKFTGNWESYVTTYNANGEVSSTRVVQENVRLISRGQGLQSSFNTISQNPDNGFLSFGTDTLASGGIVRGRSTDEVVVQGTRYRYYQTTRGRWRITNGIILINATATITPAEAGAFPPQSITFSGTTRIVANKMITFLRNSSGSTQRTVSYRPGTAPQAAARP
ncbi:MAG TPA: hypothetical protein VF585_01525 [Chthoniobacterales bacterium]